MIWTDTYSSAQLYAILDDGRVQCRLCPRKCRIAEGNTGFCGVRGTRGGRLVTLTYGKGVHITEEVIETEAVNHFAPGARILSAGNIGCNLNCWYCQNWKTSQTKYVENKDVYTYRPEDIVETALRHNIGVLSWTYNDPIIWHEFLIETARLAQQAGLINLFKSAFYISEEAVEALLPYIDIFSLSLKSMDEQYYRETTGGHLQPVLDGIKQVHRAGKHLEISNLMITDISDTEESGRKIAEWVLENLGPTIPLHYVRFHPEYQLRQTVRTPIARLRRAKEIAREIGIEHVYLGNVYDVAETSTFCQGCGALLVKRYGLTTQMCEIDTAGACTRCGRDAHITVAEKLSRMQPTVDTLPPHRLHLHSYSWRGDICSVHVQLENPTEVPADVFHRMSSTDGSSAHWSTVTVHPGESYRFVIAKGDPSDTGTEIAVPDAMIFHSHELFDRAHFPTVPMEEAIAVDDQTPLPAYTGKQVSIALPTA